MASGFDAENSLCNHRERRVAIIRKEEVKQPKKVSTLGLTPGTPTMRDLEADVEDWVEEKLLSEMQWSHLHIELSRATVPVSISSPGTGASLKSPAHPHPHDNYQQSTPQTVAKLLRRAGQ